MIPRWPFWGGNNFPGTNLHEMDLNWILGVMMDFLNKYTELEQTINNGKTEIDAKTQEDLLALTAKKDECIGLLNQWYTTHSASIASELTTQLNNAITSFNNLADQKALETIATIPADYTELSNTVLDQASAISKVRMLFDSNNFNTDFMKSVKGVKTQNAVTFTANQNNIKITGTSTGVAVFDLFNSRLDPNNFPFIGGHIYYVIFEEDESSVPIYKQIQYKEYEASNWTTIYTQSYNNDALVFQMPETFYDFNIRLTVDRSGITYNKTVKFHIFENLTALNKFDNAVYSSIKDGRMLYNELFPYKNSDIPSFYGVHITNDGENIVMIGTATSTKVYPLLNDYNNTLFKPGDEIEINFSDPANTVYIEVVTSSGGVDATPLLQTTISGTYYIRFPQNFDHVRINLLVINNTTYNASLNIKIRTKQIGRKTIIVAKDGTGDYTKLTEAIAEGIKYHNTLVIVKPGQYDLVAEYGESYLDNLNSGDYGMVLENDIELRFSPMAYVSFDYDGQNTWIIQNFSPFNTGNNLGFTIDGLVATARNCRYLIHDDPRPGQKEKYSENKYLNCILTMYPSPSFNSWKNHQIIGGGFGDNTLVVIDSCIFKDNFTDDVDYYSAVSYHNSSSGNSHYQSTIIVKNCVFSDKNRLVLEGYGTATEKSNAIITNNNMANAGTDIVYTPTTDNINVYSWNNTSR